MFQSTFSRNEILNMLCKYFYLYKGIDCKQSINEKLKIVLYLLSLFVYKYAYRLIKYILNKLIVNSMLILNSNASFLFITISFIKMFVFKELAHALSKKNKSKQRNI